MSLKTLYYSFFTYILKPNINNIYNTYGLIYKKHENKRSIFIKNYTNTNKMNTFIKYPFVSNKPLQFNQYFLYKNNTIYQKNIY